MCPGPNVSWVWLLWSEHAGASCVPGVTCRSGVRAGAAGSTRSMCGLVPDDARRSRSCRGSGSREPGGGAACPRPCWPCWPESWLSQVERGKRGVDSHSVLVRRTDSVLRRRQLATRGHKPGRYVTDDSRPYPAKWPGWVLWDLLLWANGGAVMKRLLLWVAAAVMPLGACMLIAGVPDPGVWIVVIAVGTALVVITQAKLNIKGRR